MDMTVELDVNGTRRSVTSEPERSLLQVLREDLDLTGAKYGCGEARCGACLVLMDGEPIPACITPVGDAVGMPLVTIEGVERAGRLHPLQEAFLELGAMQCGYCTPGMVIRGVAFLRENPDPTAAQVASAFDINVCRCGCHPRIVAAVLRAAERMRADTGGTA